MAIQVVRTSGSWSIRTAASCAGPWTVATSTTEAYVRQIMYRESVSIWRRNRGREVLTSQLPDKGYIETATDRIEDRLAMRELLMQLGPRQRAVIVLRFYEDLTELETARALNISVGTVKSQTAKAMERLRRAMPQAAARLSEETA